MTPPRRGARGCSCSDLPCPSTARSFLFNTDSPVDVTLSDLMTGILLTQSLNTTSPTSTAGGAICGNDLDTTTDVCPRQTKIDKESCNCFIQSNPFQAELDEVEMKVTTIVYTLRTRPKKWRLAEELYNCHQTS